MARRIKARTSTDADGSRTFEEKYPNLAAQEEWDRAQHVKAAREMGVPKSVAERHARDEVGGH